MQIIPRLFRRLAANKAPLARNSSTQASNPVRSLLYVPGNDERKLKKIFATDADCVVLDCEDGVALNRKEQARRNIYDLYTGDERVQASNKFAIRINGPQTDLAKDDIRFLFNTAYLPKTVFIPKTDYGDDIKWCYSRIYDQLERVNYSTLTHAPIKFFFYMESAASLLNLREIIETAIQQSHQKYRDAFKLEGFVFGSDDFCADIGAERTKDATELTYARQMLVTYCKAFKLKVVDMVYIDYKDLEGLRIQSEQGARMGFTGKQVIHPGQVDIVQKAFMPSEVKIKWARGLVEAFKSHQQSGKGAFTYEGQMIDMPTVLQAENILAIADK